MYSLCLLEITCQVIRWFLFSIKCMALRSSRCIQACSWSEILISAGDLALSLPSQRDMITHRKPQLWRSQLIRGEIRRLNQNKIDLCSGSRSRESDRMTVRWLWWMVFGVEAGMDEHVWGRG